MIDVHPQPLRIDATQHKQQVVTHVGGDTVYYKTDNTVSDSVFDGSLTSGQSLKLTSTKWFATARARPSDGKPGAANLSVQGFDISTPDTRVVAHAPSDNDFEYTPLDGQEAVDSSAGAQYTRVAGSWQQVSSAASGAGVPPGWINVKDSPYNCVGDGVTDDTAGLQAALTAATASTGGTLYLPPGNYCHTGLLVNTKHGWSIMGASPNSAFQSGHSRLRYTGVGSVWVEFTGTLALTNVSQMTINTAGLTGSGIIRTVIGGTGARNEKQEVGIYATAGTYTLTYSGQTTAPIAYNASPSTVQTALENLSNIAPGDVACTNDGGAALRIAGCSGFELVNVGFDYNNSSFNGYVIYVDGQGADCQDWHIRACGTKTLTSASARGSLRMYRSIIASIDNCQFTGADYQIIFGADDVNMDVQYSNGVSVGGCTFNGSNVAHILVADSDVEMVDIHDCVFEAGINTTAILGLSTNQVYSMTIDRNWFGDASTQTTWIDGLYSIRGPIVVSNNFFGDTHSNGCVLKMGHTTGGNFGGPFLCTGNSSSGIIGYVFDSYGATNVSVVSIANTWVASTIWNTGTYPIPGYTTISADDDVNNFTKPLSPGGVAEVAIGAGETAGQFIVAGSSGAAQGTFATLPAGRNAVYVGTLSGGGRRINVQAMPTSGSGVALGGGLVTGPMVEVNDHRLGLYGVSPVVMPASTGTSTGFTAGAGTTVTDQSTFTGNLGMSAPGGFNASAVASGGTFAAATYFWQITALNAAGETLPSTEKSATIVLNGSATLTWNRVPGATSYKIYRATSSGAENVSPALVTTIAAGTTTTYTDTGTATSAGAIPGASTATMAYRISDIVKALKQIGALTP